MQQIKRHLLGCLGPLLCLLLWPDKGLSQLKIGDTCPDVAFTVQWPAARKVSLAHFQGRVVLLEFWSTRCLNCLQSFPRLDSLQKQYDGTVEIILVTQESQEVVDAFFVRHKKVNRPRVMMVTGDQELSRLFPAEGYPYTVWLDRERKVRYLTGGYNTTQRHLEQFLQGETLAVRYTAVKLRRAPLWTLPDSLFRKTVLSYSTLGRCVDGWDVQLPAAELIDNGRLSQLNCACCSVLELIKLGFGENGRYPVDKRYGLLVRTKEKAALYRPEDTGALDAWRQQHAYHYQAVHPAADKERLYQMLQQELQRLFPYRIYRKEMVVPGYVLKPLRKGKQAGNAGGRGFDAYNDGNIREADSLVFRHQLSDRLAYLVDSWIGYSYPIENQLPAGLRLDFTVSRAASQGDAAVLRRELRAWGIDLVPITVKVPVVVVED